LESGYYRPPAVESVDGAWKIASHRILLDIPFALPAASA
jgi:hypothetical protein